MELHQPRAISRTLAIEAIVDMHSVKSRDVVITRRKVGITHQVFENVRQCDSQRLSFPIQGFLYRLWSV